MKKRKGILMVLLTVVLSVAMIMGTTTVGAFAETTTKSVADNVTLVSKLHYGKEVNLGAAAVKTPGGAIVKTGLDKFTPTEIGAYTVYYGVKNADENIYEYSYVVPCVLDEEYELRVEYNGADIPTYIAPNVAFTVPTASVWVVDDSATADYGYKKVTSGVTVTAKIEGANVKEEYKSDVMGKPVTLENAGTYTVHYECNIAGGSKYLTKDYTVKVQSGFEDGEAPKLNVVNIPKEISVNSKVDLPKATATDNYDANVKVKITVNAPSGGEVKHVTLDKYGYADETIDEVVKFENDYNLSFYPTELGVYTITYQAFDDSGKSTSTTQHNYTTTAVDRTAPTLAEIASEQIPSTWGETITNKASSTDSGITVGTDITFPYPKYIDNNKSADNKITVSFKITDNTNNKTVINFDNIYAKNDDGSIGDGAKYTYNANRQSNGLYQSENETEVFDPEKGFVFNFANYTKNLKDASPYGRYTVTYTARDSKPLTSTQTYEIVYEEKFSDTVEPTVTDIKTDIDYLLFSTEPEEFTVPTPVVSDNNSTRTKVEYYLTSAKLIATENVLPKIPSTNIIKLDGGEKVEYSLNGTTPTVTYTDKYTGEVQKVEFASGDKLYLTVVATDDVKNVKTSEKSITVLSAEKFNSLPSDENIDLSGLTKTVDIKQGTKVEAGGFTIKNLSPDKREYTGFEVALVLDNEVWINGDLSLTTYYDEKTENGTLVVKDIEFTAPKGHVVLYVRIYNITGLSKIVKVDYGDIGGSGGGGNIGAALNVPTSGSVYTTYQLRNKSISKPEGIKEDREYVVRKIEGKGKFSLMSSQFTAYNVGSFVFTDGYYNTSNVFTPLNKVPSYTLSVKENATPAWQILGSVPSYSPVATKENNLKVVLPKVLATSDYANAKVDLAVTDPDGNSLKVAKDDKDRNKDVTYNDNGLLEFTPSKNGTYTLTYTATYGESQTISQTFSIKVGDVIAPVFKVDAPTARVVENSKFTFNKIDVKGEETISDLRFVKNLKDASGNVVYTTDGHGATYQNRTTDSTNNAYTFTKSGNYTVEYIVYDKVGNSSIQTYTINVGAAKVNNPISTKIISTILIIVGVILIAGVILYFVRFRKVKTK